MCMITAAALVPRIVSILVHPKLDYCNSLYSNLPTSQRNSVQIIQNSVAHIVIFHMYLNLCTGSELMNELITSYFLLHTRFRQPRSPLNCITLSLSNLLACTRTFSVVTVVRRQASSLLIITDRSFHHASPHLWNKLPVSLRQPCLNQSSSPSSSSLSPIHCHIIRHTFIVSF